jgi:hypothetical protein
LSRITNAQVSDTTGAEKSNTVCKQIISKIFTAVAAKVSTEILIWL